MVWPTLAHLGPLPRGYIVSSAAGSSTATTAPDEVTDNAPHAFVILCAIIVLAAIATYLIPAGAYERGQVEGRTTVIDGTYHSVPGNPATFGDVLTALHGGMVQAAPIIFFIFIVGGAFGIVGRTGAIEAGIAHVSRRLAGRDILLIPVVMLLFGLGGATFGMFEEALPFILLLVPIAIRLGFDSLVGVGMVLVGVSAGFTAAITNPFTIGVAQGLAEVPLFSGMGPRIGFWFVFMTTSIAYVMWYARRVQKEPTRSAVHAADQARLHEMETTDLGMRVTGAQRATLVILGLTMGLLVLGVLRFSWYIPEISALFLVMGLAIGLVNRYGFNGTAQRFAQGCSDLVVGALCVGFAYAILVVLSNAQVIDTILHHITGFVGQWPAGLAALGMYLVQTLLNFVVGSGSGLAALTMPVMTPLADLLGVDRQVAVLAYQMGDGVTNIFAPQGLLLAALAMARVSYVQWVKWVWPIILVQFVLAGIFVTVAHLFIWR